MRIRLRVGWSDLAFGVWRGLFPGDRVEWERQLDELWAGTDSVLATYSVRSGFDLLLQALDLAPKSEILFSAINIPEMGKIAVWNGLVPVPVDLDFDHMAPRLESLEKAITKHTKAIVVAHLFGARIDMDPVIAFARRHNLKVIEDCAQCFAGPGFTGHPDADVSMFSFGQIKTSTALGGALFRIKDRALRGRMAARQSTYPIKSNRDFLSRAVKFGAVKIVTTWPIMAIISRSFAAFGKDYEEAIAGPVRRVAVLDSQEALMFQPSTAMLAMLVRRIRRWRPADHAGYVAKAKKLTAYLDGAVPLPGTANPKHDYWVFPVVVADRETLMKTLQRHGFDAADVRTKAFEAPPGRPELAPRAAQSVIGNLLVLPCYPEIPDRELKRQAEILRRETRHQITDINGFDPRDIEVDNTRTALAR